MGLIWTPQQRTRQPQNAVRVNWAHPLNQRSILLWNAANASSDPVVGNVAAINGPVRSISSSGVATKFSAASSQYIDCGSTPTLAGLSDATFVVAYTLTSLPGPNAGFALLGKDHSSGGRQFAVMASNFSSGVGQRLQVNGGSSTLGTNDVWDAVTLSANTPYVVVVVWAPSQNRSEIWVNGQQTRLTTASGTFPSASSTLRIGSRQYTSYEGYINGSILYARILARAWSGPEIRQFYQNPWQVYSEDAPSWFTDAEGGITGTSAVTEGSDSAAATGLITHLGTSAVTDSGDVAAAIGYLSHLGTAAVTEGADAASAAGHITHTATAAITEGSDTADATGTVGATSITGTAAITEAGDTATVIGYLSHLGSAAITESGDIAAATVTAGDPLHGFTQDQLDFLVSYMEAHMAIPTAAENAAAVRAEIAVELAAVVRSEKWVRNKRTLDPATGMQRIYDDDGATVLGEGEAWLDADGSQPYDGSGAVHRTDRLA